MAEKEYATEGYVISVAAELSGMHAQTLRTYDRLGIVTPQRTRGGGRRYSQQDVELLQTVQRLSQEEGMNLAGIKAIIELKKENAELRSQLQAAQAEIDRLNFQQRGGELVHVPRSTAVVMWKPRWRKREQ
ncbi:MAG: helix-turn-helix transcriptional regulator [Corynebacterium sp.]|nr:helix-turn-helix transcriptional regulator [Corynebacterium sp.]